MVSHEKSTDILFSHYRWGVIFQYCYVSSVFRSLIIMCLSMDFFGFFLFRFAQLLDSVNLFLLSNLGSFQLLFIKYFFSPFYSSPSGTLMNECYILCYKSHKYPRLYSFFFQSIFSLLFWVSNLYFSIFQFTDFFPLSSILLMSLWTVPFILVITFFPF